MRKSSHLLHGRRNGEGLRILVTGASGLLGSKLAEFAIDAGHVVFPVCNQHPTTRGNALRVDLTNAEEVRKTLVESRPEVVLHTASITDVDFCERNPGLAMETNGEATKTIAQTCNELNSFLVYVSTDYVFDGLTGLYREEDRPNPVNVYGRSKLLGEEMVSKFAGDSCIVRTSVVFGWGREYRPNFATWLLDRLSKGESVSVIDGQYASPTLNTHLARMLLEAAERRINGTVHIAGTDRLSRYQFAGGLAREFGYDLKLLVPTAPAAVNWYAKRPPDSSLNVEKAIRIFKLKPCTVNDELREFKMERDLIK